MATMPASSASTAVDLSRLPPPDVVEQLSYEQILAGLIAAVQAAIPGFDATVESEPVVKLLQVVAYRELLIRQDFNDRARSVMLAYAGGADLDQLAALVGVSRLLVTPADELTGAAAVYEVDDALRARVTLAPESFSVAGPELAYVFHARSADADVLDASATSPAPGQVVVTVLSRAGNGEASAELLGKVAAVVNADEVRPLTDLVTVQSADVVEFAIAAQLVIYQGPDSSVVMAAAEASLQAYLEAGQRLGRDITLSGLYAALHVAGVQRVDLASPAVNLVLGPTQAPWCTGINLTSGGVGE
jgi:phage-related baseplate assembly protein